MYTNQKFYDEVLEYLQIKPQYLVSLAEWIVFCRDRDRDVLDIRPEYIEAYLKGEDELARVDLLRGLFYLLDFIQDNIYSCDEYSERWEVVSGMRWPELWDSPIHLSDLPEITLEIPPHLRHDNPTALSVDDELDDELGPIEDPPWITRTGRIQMKHRPGQGSFYAHWEDFSHMLHDMIRVYYDNPAILEITVVMAQFANWVYISGRDVLQLSPDHFFMFLTQHSELDWSRAVYAYRFTLSHLMTNTEHFDDYLGWWESIDERLPQSRPDDPTKLVETALRLAVLSLRDQLSANKIARLTFGDLTDDIRTHEVEEYVSLSAGNASLENRVFPVYPSVVRAILADASIPPRVTSGGTQ